MANLIASPAQMALKLLEVEERLEKVEKKLQTLKKVVSRTYSILLIRD